MSAYEKKQIDLSPLIIEQIAEVADDKQEEKFLIELLKTELTYYAYADTKEGFFKPDYKFLLDKYFPFVDESGES